MNKTTFLGHEGPEHPDSLYKCFLYFLTSVYTYQTLSCVIYGEKHQKLCLFPAFLTWS